MPILGKELEFFPDDVIELPTSDAPWEVAHLRSRHEKAVARVLLAAKSPFYLPQIEQKTAYSDRVLVSRLPLFPGYLFLRRGPGLRQALWRTGALVKVIEVVDQTRLTVELRQIWQLQASGASLTLCADVARGDAVRIKEGPFCGYCGIVREERGSLRLIVSVSMIGKSIAVEFPRGRLVRLSEEASRGSDPPVTALAGKANERIDPGHARRPSLAASSKALGRMPPCPGGQWVASNM